jgi:hypothetical protein
VRETQRARSDKCKNETCLLHLRFLLVMGTCVSRALSEPSTVIVVPQAELRLSAGLVGSGFLPCGCCLNVIGLPLEFSRKIEPPLFRFAKESAG